MTPKAYSAQIDEELDFKWGIKDFFRASHLDNSCMSTLGSQYQTCGTVFICSLHSSASSQ